MDVPLQDPPAKTKDPTRARFSPPSGLRKILVTAFILFHLSCVAVSVFPGRLRLRGILYSLSAPLPARRVDSDSHALHWTIEPLPLVSFYLGKTCQWQNWNLFAPNPMNYSRYLAGRVTYRSGKWREITLPRLEQLDLVHAHLHARYREYEYALAGPHSALRDLARFMVRSLNDPSDPALRVDLYVCQQNTPSPDALKAGSSGAPSPPDYSKLLRDEARYVRHTLLAYPVQPEDLR